MRCAVGCAQQQLVWHIKSIFCFKAQICVEISLYCLTLRSHFIVVYSLFTNKYDCSIFDSFPFIYLDFTLPCSRIPINPIQYCNILPSNLRSSMWSLCKTYRVMLPSIFLLFKYNNLHFYCSFICVLGMRSKEQNRYFPGCKNSILRRNELPGKVGNIGNCLNFHISKLAGLPLCCYA
jgi:hypothetical protein